MPLTITMTRVRSFMSNTNSYAGRVYLQRLVRKDYRGQHQGRVRKIGT